MASLDTGPVRRWPTRDQPWRIAAFALWAIALVLLVVRGYVDGSWPLIVWFVVIALSAVCIVNSERRYERFTDTERFRPKNPPK